MIKAPEDAAERASANQADLAAKRQAAKLAAERITAISEATGAAEKAAAKQYGTMRDSDRSMMAVGTMQLAIRLLELLPEQAMTTWLAYQGETEQLVDQGQHASAAWSSRTAHVAVSQIAEQGRLIATEAWPFIAWLPRRFIQAAPPAGTEAGLREWFGDSILLMPAWLDELQSQ